jgi:uncharacterized membrane protein YqjE
MAVSPASQDLRDRSTGELVKDLSRQVSILIRKEIELAKAEMAEKGKRAGVGVGMIGGAAVSALLALGSLTAFLILLFALAVPAWAAALIVTALWAGVAIGLGLYGRQRVREVGMPAPEMTIDSVKEDVRWLTTRQ